MSDLIERQAAIDLINDIDLINFTAKGVIRDRLRKLTSAQPKVIHCKDCEWWTTKRARSLQGRCELMQMYPTGEWFCGNAQKKETEETEEQK